MATLETTLINDTRTSTDFRIYSFSGFKKTDVKKQLIENIFKGKVEPACYWCAELVCAGHYMDIWEILLHYLGKYIHAGNPKLAIYLEKRFAVFKNIMMQGLFYDELQLRNHSTIREMFAEICCIFATSPKKNSFEQVKIKREEEFDMTQMPERLKAPTTEYAEPFFRKEDPKELWIAINEFAFQISPINPAPNMMNACYWIEWVIEFDTICKNRKQKCLCDRRYDIPVEPKFQCDIILLIWDALVYSCKEKKNPFLEKIMDSLMKLFCVKYTAGSAKKRRYLLYYAVSVVTEPIMNNVEIINNKPLLETVINKIHTIYKQIKKNEVSPNMDYLYSGLESQSNLEKTIQKMEMLGNMDPFSKTF
jgi:hypothetical protein